MGYLSILTPRQHDSHPGATTGMTVCKAAAAELKPHKLAPIYFAIPLLLLNNHYECSFLPTSTICNAHNLATRLSLPGSMQHSWNSQGESLAARLYILHGTIYGLVISYMYTHTQVHKSPVQSHPLEDMICLAASKLTSFSYNPSLLHHFVEFTGGWLAWRKFWC